MLCTEKNVVMCKILQQIRETRSVSVRRKKYKITNSATHEFYWNSIRLSSDWKEFFLKIDRSGPRIMLENSFTHCCVCLWWKKIGSWISSEKHLLRRYQHVYFFLLNVSLCSFFYYFAQNETENHHHEASSNEVYKHKTSSMTRVEQSERIFHLNSFFICSLVAVVILWWDNMNECGKAWWWCVRWLFCCLFSGEFLCWLSLLLEGGSEAFT